MIDDGKREKRLALGAFAWRGLCLLAALRLGALTGQAGDPPWALLGLAALLWAFLGYKPKRPGFVASGIAVVVLLGALWIWDLRWTIALFAPLWAALWFLPRALPPLRGGSHTAGSALEGGLERLERKHPRLAETAGVVIALGAGAIALSPFLHHGIMGGEDAKWYTAVVADHLLQWRAGEWPVFVGQTPLAAFGTVFPLRVAPYLQHFTVLLDVLTGRSLTPFFLLNLAIFLSACGGGLSAYLCLRSLMPGRRSLAALLAVLYLWSPAVVGLAYTGQLFMSTMTWPYVPLVAAGLILFVRGDRRYSLFLVAIGCAACFLCHSPIGLWSTATAAGVIGLAWFTAKRTLADYLRALAAAGLFLALCGYVFVSMRVLSPPETPPTLVDVVQATVRRTFPAVLLPVGEGAGRLSDIQLGYSLWLVLLASAVGIVRRRKPAEAGPVLAALGLVLLLLPVPFINRALWDLVPQTVINVTNAAPNQRLYLILAGLTVALACLALGREGTSSRILPFLIAAGVVWSGLQLRPFLQRGHQIANSRETSEMDLKPQNLALGRYSVSLLNEKNRHFSHGVVDFHLEQRILDPDTNATLVSNLTAVAPGFGDPTQELRPPELTAQFTGTSERANLAFVPLSPELVLEPGKRYLLAFDFGGKDYHGVLQLRGSGLYREYTLPLSGEPFAFGSAPRASRVLAVWTDASEPVRVKLTWIQQGGEPVDWQNTPFARYRLYPYQPEHLPIRLKSFLPYEAEAESPRVGWLETFRYFTRGWTATVNGLPAEVRRSWNGLVAVRLSPGRNLVQLRYRPPTALLLSYWVMAASWAAVVVGALWLAFRRWTAADGDPTHAGA